MSPERIILEAEESQELVDLHLARYHFARRFVEKKRVADIACGTGYGTAVLAEGGPASLVGIDVSHDAIDYADTHYRKNGVEFREGSIEVLDSPLDLVVSFETIEHVKEPWSFLDGLVRHLDPSGTLLISTPLRQRGSLEDKPENPFHEREWNAEEFTALLQRYFRVVDPWWQFIVRKLPIPGSRTALHHLSRLLYPVKARELRSYGVRKEPLTMAPIPIVPGYLIAVCREAIGHVR